MQDGTVLASEVDNVTLPTQGNGHWVTTVTFDCGDVPERTERIGNADSAYVNIEFSYNNNTHDSQVCCMVTHRNTSNEAVEVFFASRVYSVWSAWVTNE